MDDEMVPVPEAEAMRPQQDADGAALAAEMVVAATTGAITGGPLAAVLGLVSPPAAKALALLARRVSEVERTAFVTSGLEPDDLAARLLESEARFSVAQRILTGAQSAATAKKRELLGRMLGNAALENDVDIEEMLIHAQILVELEAPHIQVLSLLEEAGSERVPKDPGTGGVAVAKIAELLPNVWLYSNAVMIRLQGHSLIDDASAGTWGALAAPGQSWKLSEFGRDFLRMLREPAENARDRESVTEEP